MFLMFEEVFVAPAPPRQCDGYYSQLRGNTQSMATGCFYIQPILFALYMDVFLWRVLSLGSQDDLPRALKSFHILFFQWGSCGRYGSFQAVLCTVQHAVLS